MGQYENTTKQFWAIVELSEGVHEKWAVVGFDGYCITSMDVALLGPDGPKSSNSVCVTSYTMVAPTDDEVW